MKITTLQFLLLQDAAGKLPTLQVGLLTQLYSPNPFGLRSDRPRVVRALKAHRELGHPRSSVADNIRVLGDAGYLVAGTVTGERGERYTSTVRLLSDAEVVAFLGLGGAVTKGSES